MGLTVSTHTCTQMRQRHTHDNTTTLQLDQLPKPHQQNQTLLPDTRQPTRKTTRQQHTTRIRNTPPSTPQILGQPTSTRHHTHMRQMRTTSNKHRPMGLRPHRKQTRLHRTRTHTLQPQSRSTKQQQNARTLATLNTTHKPNKHNNTNTHKHTKQNKNTTPKQTKPNTQHQQHPGSNTQKPNI